eukprot:1161671-Pelagomonas_calceolata.AAC.28
MKKAFRQADPLAQVTDPCKGSHTPTQGKALPLAAQCRRGRKRWNHIENRRAELSVFLSCYSSTTGAILPLQAIFAVLDRAKMNRGTHPKPREPPSGCDTTCAHHASESGAVTRDRCYGVYPSLSSVLGKI